jgi:hypothetical protein
MLNKINFYAFYWTEADSKPPQGGLLRAYAKKKSLDFRYDRVTRLYTTQFYANHVHNTNTTHHSSVLNIHLATLSRLKTVDFAVHFANQFTTRDHHFSDGPSHNALRPDKFCDSTFVTLFRHVVKRNSPQWIMCTKIWAPTFHLPASLSTHQRSQNCRFHSAFCVQSTKNQQLYSQKVVMVTAHECSSCKHHHVWWVLFLRSHKSVFFELGLTWQFFLAQFLISRISIREWGKECCI